MRFITTFCLTIALLLISLDVDARRPAPEKPPTTAERAQSWQQHQQMSADSPWQGLTWRSIGPVVQGGRIVDLAVHPEDTDIIYAAYASGGLWKSTNAGQTFTPLFEDQATMIMGDIAIAPSNPQVIWVGTGENNSSRSSYGGYGVYRSTDGGETFVHKGLVNSDRIGRIVADPSNENRAFVAALGKLYTQGGQRGIYLTEDGGETWQQVLAGEGWTGFIDLVMHPENSDILYAAAWERYRRPWEFYEGGEGSGIYKSTDGGENWTRLDGGFPRGEHVGRIGLAIAASQPDTVYAALDNQEKLAEEDVDLGDAALTAQRLKTMSSKEFLAQDPEAIEDFIRASDLETSLDADRLIMLVRDGELSLKQLIEELSDANANLFDRQVKGLQIWRSDDAGANWRLTHDDPLNEVVFSYGYYFGQVRVAPDDPERVYTMGVPLIASSDGGKTWQSLQDESVHVDHHALWINPADPDHLMSGNDGGLDVSFDDGQSWSKLDHQATGQFYTINVDLAEPYNVYGGLQDNGTMKGPSTAEPEDEAWSFIGGGDGMYVNVDPRDNKTLYVGYQFGFYQRREPDGESRAVRPRDAVKEPALRYNWSTPVILSEHNADVIYYGSNRVYRSLDKGENWTALTDDLAESDERGDVPFGTVTTLAESDRVFGLLYAGTDDGQLRRIHNGKVVNIGDGLPRNRWVSRLEPSHHEDDRVYASLNGYRDDDIAAYVYVSEDRGNRWRSIADGLPAEAVNVVREDPVNADLLYVGTDRGVYASIDRGESWQALDAGLPNVPVHDLVIHPRERELVAGTHGRSAWIADVLPLQEMTSRTRDEALKVFPLRAKQFKRSWRSRDWRWQRDFDEPELSVPFWSDAAGEVEMTVENADGASLFTQSIEADRGINHALWNLRVDQELALDAEQAALQEDYDPMAEGAKAKVPYQQAVNLEWPLYLQPGDYQVVLQRGEAVTQTELTMKPPEDRQPRAIESPPIRGIEDDGEE